MVHSTNFPLSNYCLRPYGGWEAVEKEVKTLGLDGLEVIADPDDLADDIPLSLVAGYHMTFFADWVDFFRQDKDALKRKFGSLECAESFYRCKTPEDMIDLYRRDLALALRLGAPYAVIHVADVSLEEGYTYRWEHTDYVVMDAALEVINEILRDIPPTMDFLVENQWWPGFTFTEPEKTEYLLSHINYPRVGVMLDTGHAMNTNWSIKNQREGVSYILSLIEKHGELSESIRGLHFHQSMSGGYCKKFVDKVPEDFPKDYYERFAQSYGHILKIDRHRPWTDPECIRILDRVQPKYLTHELSGSVYRGRPSAIRSQMRVIEKRRRMDFDKQTEGPSTGQSRKANTKPAPTGVLPTDAHI